MELGVAYDSLCRVLEPATTEDAKALAEEKGAGMAIASFRSRLEAFVRAEIGRFGDLQGEVYNEIRAWHRENVGAGKGFPKSFLFPRSAVSVPPEMT